MVIYNIKNNDKIYKTKSKFKPKNNKDEIFCKSLHFQFTLIN